ncbi:ankyrin repeat domain-containing protein [Rhodococcus aetherivorans]|uniref:ankyrin repeat domain-containing protein n=1 Tax=Rhodococcus aetherivorans TaxID=191292 RepID=UPI00366D7C8E
MHSIDEIVRAVYRKDVMVLDSVTPEEVNLRDEDGRTPLMHAMLAEDTDPAIVALLIDRGADVDVADSDQKWTALHFAARDQNEAQVRLLLKAGADVDPVDVFGNTPLWRSVMNSRSDLAAMKLLIEHGADPHLRNHHGISPLDLARQSGQDDVVALFVRRDRRHRG